MERNMTFYGKMSLIKKLMRFDSISEIGREKTDHTEKQRESFSAAIKVKIKLCS